MSQLVKYVGLDVHKDTIAVAVAEDGKRFEVREHAEIANTPGALAKLLAKLAGPDVELHICYEAGPCGYGIQRQVAVAGHSCVVVAPSLIPSRPGDRVKTDRRDAVKLARLHRAGELTPVWIPDGGAHEAMRDLIRARMAAVRSLREVRRGGVGKAPRQDRATRDRPGFFSESLGSMSVARRRSKIDPAHHRLSMSAQCRLQWTASYLVYRSIINHPRKVRTFEYISIAIQAGAVISNLRVVF